ncbi:MAG: 3-deoxy-7-phosphoheptulonate synthase [archaeon]|nr:3-deoxy-7-phosphoheptulonate synthase [archaeon]
MKLWSVNSWRKCTREQEPAWYDNILLKDTLSKISNLPALVFAGETRSLIKDLEQVGQGKAFLLQCGDCSENFIDCNGPKIHNFIRFFLQMSIILSYGGNKKVVNVGRIAGQYAKPRSSEIENITGVELPVYRGDMVNSFEPDFEKRRHDPDRMLQGYFRSAATINLIRAFLKGGYASPEQILDWQKLYFADYPIMKKYEQIASQFKASIDFITTLKLDINNKSFNETDMYTSHESLLLEYEETMTRVDTTTGLFYNTSAHMLWVGDRTRQPDNAHIEFLRGINNPVGIKIGPQYDINDIIECIKKLNPENKLGKLCLIVRFGVANIEQLLPDLIHAVKRNNFNIVWICDPMHGNSYVSDGGKKVRNLDDIFTEIGLFFKIHKKENTFPGGVHLELTSENVTECIGGITNITKHDLDNNYTTTCDPRLNASQSVELAFFVANLIKENEK